MGADLIEKVPHAVGRGEAEIASPGAGCARCHLRPELAEAVHAGLRRIAGDDGGVDRADGDAGDPVGIDLGLGERGVDAGLVGAERAAALQHQGDAFKGKTSFCEHVAQAALEHSYRRYLLVVADMVRPIVCCSRGVSVGARFSSNDGKASEELLAPECDERDGGHHQAATEARLLDVPDARSLEKLGSDTDVQSDLRACSTNSPTLANWSGST